MQRGGSLHFSAGFGPPELCAPINCRLCCHSQATPEKERIRRSGEHVSTEKERTELLRLDVKPSHKLHAGIHGCGAKPWLLARLLVPHCGRSTLLPTGTLLLWTRPALPPPVPDLLRLMVSHLCLGGCWTTFFTDTLVATRNHLHLN